MSVNLTTLDAYGVKEKDTTQAFGKTEFRNEGIRITPTVTYFRTFAKNLGYGISLGYYVSNQNINYSYIGINEFFEYSFVNKSSGIYLQPSIIEQFDMKNYLLVFSVNVPIQYNFKSFSNHFEQLTLFTTTIYTDEIKVTYPKQLNVGLNLGGGVHRKIGKSLMIGAELNLGIFSYYVFGKRVQTSNYTENNVTTEYISQTKVNQYRYRLAMNPMLSVSYRF